MVIVVVGHLPPCVVLSELSPSLSLHARTVSNPPFRPGAPGASTPGFAGIIGWAAALARVTTASVHGAAGSATTGRRERTCRRWAGVRYHRTTTTQGMGVAARARVCLATLHPYRSHTTLSPAAAGLGRCTSSPAAGSRQAETDGSDKDLATAPPRIRTVQAASSTCGADASHVGRAWISFPFPFRVALSFGRGSVRPGQRAPNDGRGEYYVRIGPSDVRPSRRGPQLWIGIRIAWPPMAERGQRVTHTVATQSLPPARPVLPSCR